VGSSEGFYLLHDCLGEHRLVGRVGCAVQIDSRSGALQMLRGELGLAKDSSPDALLADLGQQSTADRLTTLGYTNVRMYREGIQDWVEAGLRTETA
jgi:hypothetical protein